MTLHELQDRALRLSAEERWQLINALMRSLQPKPRSKVKLKGLAASLIGIAKTDAPPPTDAEVKAMLDERLVQKYLRSKFYLIPMFYWMQCLPGNLF
jgi:hypothetical protein